MEICIKSGEVFMQEKTISKEQLSDKEIISLFFDRDERAIAAVCGKYGGYCNTVAANILNNPQDAEECVNDTWLKAWETIPPEKPRNLGGFLAKIVKNLCLNRLEYHRAKKRGCGEIPLVLDELKECLSDANSVEKTYENKVLTDAINDFLKTLSREKRDMFVLRYWYCLPVAKVAELVGVSRNNAATTLSRTRRSLMQYLEKRRLL